jgi:hemerythrin-like domain-containing protein
VCEYCGCQQITVIDELTREHDAVVALMASVRELLVGDRLEDVAATCERILEVLEPHTRVEELGLFPEIAVEFPEHVSVLVDEHRRIEAVLGEARHGVPADPTWPDRLQRALFDLREHILKEQDGVFPAALTMLDGEQWARVEKVRFARFDQSGYIAAPTGRTEP